MNRLFEGKNKKENKDDKENMMAFLEEINDEKDLNENLINENEKEKKEENSKEDEQKEKQSGEVDVKNENEK